MYYKTLRVIFVPVSLAALLSAQAAAQSATSSQSVARTPTHSTGTVHGTVKDSTAGVIPDAVVTLTNSNGTVQTQESGRDGSYTFRGVAPGSYTISATYAGLRQEGVKRVNVTAAQETLGNITMTLQPQRQEVTVTDTATNTVSTEPSNNATALVLKQEDLDALPDDPDDLQADLQALAGPSAGPTGNQIYIDGFTGGRLPPKDSIREIRINSNPFSAEFDKLGYGRIQIFTKPGSDKFHGQSYYSISDDVWNARNPFVFPAPPFKTQLFGGNVSGPFGKHGSFFIDAERRNIDDNGVLTATVPTPDFLGTTRVQSYYPTPQRRTTVSPRADFQLGANHTLSFRYSFLENDHLVSGIGGYYLPNTTIGNILFPSSGYSSSITDHTVQIVETAVLSPKAINETHFQYDRSNTGYTSQSTAPELEVQGSFISGGAGYTAPGYPSNYQLENNYELQNYTSLTWGTHASKFGIRVRATVLDYSNPTNFNGAYQFNGGAFPRIGSDGLPVPGTSETISSIQQYLTTVQLLNQGYSSQQVTTQFGYGPSKFTMTSGHPYINVSQLDFGPFIQDDWRVRPNLTLSLGLRWESQTNINDKSNWAPRVGFAWAPGQKGNSRAKTVLRGGWGIFYDRFAITNVLTAEQNNGINQITYTQERPDVYNAAFSITPPLNELAAATSSAAAQTYQIDSHLQAPRLMETAVGLERQLFGHTTLSVNFVNSRGVHEFRTVDINAPYASPGSLPCGTPSTVIGGTQGPCLRPYGDVRDIYNFESDAVYKQTQVLVNVNSAVGRWLTLFTRYSYGTAHSDADGIGTFASDPYNFFADWGRSSLDIRNSFFLGGSITTRFGLRFSPFIVARSGTPFNFTTGNDLFLQGQKGRVVRPGAASGPGPYIVDTPYGFLDEYPLVPEPGTSDFVERNAETGPGYIGVNLRVSKTWGFGTTKFKGVSGGARSGGGGGRGGGSHGGFGGFGPSPRGFGGSESTEHRYNLTLSASARNIFNHTNLASPVGVITSPFFLESTGITGGFAAENTSSENRRIDLQLRFSF